MGQDLWFENGRRREEKAEADRKHAEIVERLDRLITLMERLSEL